MPSQPRSRGDIGKKVSNSRGQIPEEAAEKEADNYYNDYNNQEYVDQQPNNYYGGDTNGNGDTGGGQDVNTLNALAAKHDQYASEIDKIREMLGDDN